MTTATTFLLLTPSPVFIWTVNSCQDCFGTEFVATFIPIHLVTSIKNTEMYHNLQTFFLVDTNWAIWE